uniref:Soluble calcium-activated nucleotidase 1 n=1 Tax=Parascaris univalens TaxID=6257 RepID=A0A915AST6_PARUN
ENPKVSAMPKGNSNATGPSRTSIPHRLSASSSGRWSTTSLIVVTALTTMLIASFISLTLKMQQPGCDRSPYNTSQLGKVIKLDDGSRVYEVVVVTDLDHDSKDATGKNWYSYIKRGVITINKELSKASVVWQDGKEVLLVDGAGNETKGFKGEWLTVKDGELWAGGLGKEWTTTEGVFVNRNPMWVKRITNDGCVRHVNWEEPYKQLRGAIGIHYPGYMIHESAQWSTVHRKWFFMPRRASKLMYTEAEDESRGTNYLLTASEDFSHVDARQVGKQNGPRGFSAFQFVPETKDQIIVALKSEEKDGVPVATYITIFDFQSGHILLDEQPLQGKYKYEGIAFV